MMIQQLRALTSTAKDQGLFSSSYMVAQHHLNFYFKEIQHYLLAFAGNRHIHDTQPQMQAKHSSTLNKTSYLKIRTEFLLNPELNAIIPKAMSYCKAVRLDQSKRVIVDGYGKRQREKQEKDQGVLKSKGQSTRTEEQMGSFSGAGKAMQDLEGAHSGWLR